MFTVSKDDVLAYVKDHKIAWSLGTQKSEKNRLMPYVEALNGDPHRLWDEFEKRELAPYSRVVLWIRVCHFWDWLIEVGGKIDSKENLYRAFRRNRKNARLFKNAYTRKIPSVSFDEARDRISKIEDPAIKGKALELLLTGMRYAESFTVIDGVCTGKGGKKRHVFFEKSKYPQYKGSYETFLHALKDTADLKPHDLRKIFLSSLVARGVNNFQLKTIAGWEHISTAEFYINTDVPTLEKLVTSMVKGKDSGTNKRRVHK